MIAKLFHENNIQLSSRTNNKVSNYIKNNKNKKLQKLWGLLTCGNCQKIYIGQTETTFDKRIAGKLQLLQFEKIGRKIGKCEPPFRTES